MGRKVRRERCNLSLLVVLAVGCGLRTDPTDYERSRETDPSSDGRGPARTCEDPGLLPTVSSAVESVLQGASRATGSCGGDAGPEHVYRFRPVEPSDVTLRFLRPEMGPAANVTYRVYRGSCQDEDARLLCDDTIDLGDEDDAQYFYAEPGDDYFIVIDSAQRDPEPQAYAFEFDLDPPSIGRCPIHSELIEQDAGRVFRWNNDFSPGTGRLTGACGGIGKENMFRVDIDEPAFVQITVQGEDGFEPVINLRTGCGGTTEIACDSARSIAVLEHFFEEPGIYYLVVDSRSDGGGSYELEVVFD